LVRFSNFTSAMKFSFFAKNSPFFHRSRRGPDGPAKP
jgi:hypothetical protein